MLLTITTLDHVTFFLDKDLAINFFQLIDDLFQDHQPDEITLSFTYTEWQDLLVILSKGTTENITTSRSRIVELVEYLGLKEIYRTLLIRALADELKQDRLIEHPIDLDDFLYPDRLMSKTRLRCKYTRETGFRCTGTASNETLYCSLHKGIENSS